MQVKCHRTISALMWTKRLKAFSSMRKNAFPMHLFILGLLWLFQVSLQGCLHFQHLSTLTHFPMVEPDCTGEHVNVVSEHSSLCLGNDTPIKHLHGNAIKSFFLWIVQPVLEDSGRKCSVQCNAARGGQRIRDRGGEVCAICILHLSHSSYIHHSGTHS